MIMYHENKLSLTYFLLLPKPVNQVEDRELETLASVPDQIFINSRGYVTLR